ncbi:putative gustatory receptor 28b [Armigeres subalbatus]|uniref:putative gustatory receptor 28b n=1 Tax=Armigeres subalbatus TaxID=124917 RepID=UPI002ED4C771
MSQTSPSVNEFGWLQVVRMVIVFSWTLGCYQTLTSNTIMLLSTIRRRFIVLNIQIEKYLDTLSADSSPTADRHRKMMRNFALMHSLLSDSVRLFNDCFSKQVMLALGCAFIYTLLANFGLIHSYAAVHVDAVMIKVTRSNMIFSLYFVLFVFQFVVCCNWLNYECKRCRVTIHKAVCYQRYDIKSFREYKFFSQQLMHHAPVVSSGLFDFDWTPCYTLIGSSTTNLVILLQFDFINLKI